MNYSKIILSLTLVGAFVPAAAFAMPSASNVHSGSVSNIVPARLVCDAYGRCYRVRPPVYGVVPGPGYRVQPYGGPVYGGPDDGGQDFGVRRGFGNDDRRENGDGQKRRRDLNAGDQDQRHGQIDRQDNGQRGSRRLPNTGNEGRQQGGDQD